MASNELETPTGKTLTINAALLPFTNSNDELPEMLVPLCRQNLEEIEAASSDINRKIDELKGHDESLLKDQKRVLHMKILCESLLSPVRRIPNELIGQVICSCFDNPAILDTTDRQLFAIVRSVCRQWRTVALASHDLWRGLSVSDDLTSDIGRKITSWFRHGGPTPNLTLKVSSQTLPPDIRQLLLHRQCRWTQISLHLPSTVLAHFMFHLQSTQNPWHELQSLEVHHQPTPSGTVIPCTFFLEHMNTRKSNLPSLRSLHFKQATLIPPLRSKLSHATLSTLCLSMCMSTPDIIRQIVDPQHLPCLEELTLIQVYSTRPESTPPPMVSHPRIRRVVLRDITTSTFVPMFLFPNLEFAEMSHIWDQRSISLIEAFLDRCGSDIHTLVLRGKSFAFSQEQAVALTRLLPTLHHLHIPDLEMFAHLILRKPGYLPTLDMLSCHGSNIKLTAANVDAIIAYLEQRRERSMGDSKPLTIRFIDEVALLEQEGFQRLQRCGQVRIHLLSHGQMNPKSPMEVFHA
ncbi:hypothetical protein BKA70DRAFT_1285951 [Coprinopsis sp. MPI-PUGE-AT-0042]|nr:hypothetical protein BKA70DRAFT_1285951 [Coprinopsis sp. MPI-PUGE-AT-0042]